MKSYPSRLQHPSGAWMNLEHDRALVELDAEAGAGAADNTASILGRIGLVEEESGRPSAVAPSGRPLQPLNHTANRRWARSQTGAGVNAEAAAAQGEDGVRWIGPVYRMELDGQTEYLSLIPNVLLIAAAPGAEAKSLGKMAKRFGLVKDEARSEYLGAYDCYTVQSPAKASALELIDVIAAEELVRDVRYETMPMYVPTSFVPNDPLYPQQWGMERIQAGGAGQTAWNLQQGSAAVWVSYSTRAATSPILISPTPAPESTWGRCRGTAVPRAATELLVPASQPRRSTAPRESQGSPEVASSCPSPSRV